MSHWFRMYDELLDDPKVQKLLPETFKVLINCFCLASKNGSQDGYLGTLDDVSFALRETFESVSSAFHTLVEQRLIETVGETFHVANWKKRQYKSDISTERVKRYRDRSKAVSETPRARNRNRYRTDTDTEKKDMLSSISAHARPPDEEKNKTDFQKVFDRGCELFPQLATASAASIRQWLAANCNPDTDIIPEIERYSRANKTIGAWSFFTGSIMDAYAKRTTPPPKGNPNAGNAKSRPSATHTGFEKQDYRAGTEGFEVT